MTYYYIPKRTRYWRTRSITVQSAAWKSTTSKRDVVYTDADCISKSLIKYYFKLPEAAAPWNVISFDIDDVTECEDRKALEVARIRREVQTDSLDDS